MYIILCNPNNLLHNEESSALMLKIMSTRKLNLLLKIAGSVSKRVVVIPELGGVKKASRVLMLILFLDLSANSMLYSVSKIY